MTRLLMTMTLWAVATATTFGHFVWVVADPGGQQARLFISETLSPDPEVNAELVRPSKLLVRTGGTDTPLTLAQTSDAYALRVPGTGTRVIHGVTDLGVSTQGPDGKPHILVYYPKAIIGDAFDAGTIVGATAIAELIPVRDASGVRLKYVTRGQVRPDTEITLVTPSGDRKLRTDRTGVTPAITGTGQFGAWARFWEDTPGTRNGEAYGQVRHYATLVFTVTR